MPQPTPESIQFSRTRTRTYDAQNDVQSALRTILELICPAGAIVPTLLTTEPGDGWKLCNGQRLLKAEFPRLAAIIGGRFGQDALYFHLPDLQGRAPFGAGGIGDLMAFGGAATLTLTIEQIPAHDHALTDPGHTHVFTAAPHTHAITDPGHTHTAAADAAAAASVGDAVAAAVSGSTGESITGVTVDPAIATGDNADAQTGITMSETGGGQPVPIMPPFFAVNWMVRT
jgi:microcystin-dependent protein